MEKIKVGQIVYRKRTDYRGSWNGEILENEVERIGKKYFYLKGCERNPVGLATLYYNSEFISSSFRVYLSKQEILDEAETNNLITSIRKAFDYYNRIELPLPALREIQSIIDKNAAQ